MVESAASGGLELLPAENCEQKVHDQRSDCGGGSWNVVLRISRGGIDGCG